MHWKTGGRRVNDDDLSISHSNISFDSTYMDEQQHLKATGRSVEVVYENHIKEQGIPFSVSLLLSMSTGELNAKESMTETLNNYVSKQWLALSAVRVTASLLKEELTRRYDLARAVEEDEKPKKPRLSCTIAKLTEQLQQTGALPLKYVSERRYLIRKIKEVVKRIADDQKEKEEEKMQRGDHIISSTLLRMRLVHGK